MSNETKPRAQTVGGIWRSRSNRVVALFCTHTACCPSEKTKHQVREADEFGIHGDLISLDAGELDHPCPLFCGFGDDRSEFRRRAPEHGAAQVDDPRLDLAVGEAGIGFPVQRGDGDLEPVLWKLVSRLRENEIALDHPGLAEYLRESAVNQVAIDQPGCSGFKTALANAEG